MAHTILPADYSTNISKLSIPFSYSRVTVFSPEQSLAFSWYFVFDNTCTPRRSFDKSFKIMNFQSYFWVTVFFLARHERLSHILSSTFLLSTKSLLLWYLHYHVDVCLSTLLTYFLNLLHLAPVESNEVFGNLFGRFDRIVIWCIAVLMQGVPSVILLTNTKQYGINCIYCRSVFSEFMCESLSFTCVDFIASFFNRYIWHVFALLFAFFAIGGNEWQSIDMVFGIPSLLIVIVAGDASINLNGPVLWDIILLYSSVAKRSVPR